MTYGFLGLGQMGLPMARNLAAQYPLLAFDRNEEACAAANAAGVRTVAQAGDLADCELLILCLPHGEAVEASLLGEDGLADRLGAGACVIDTSTIEYQRSLRIAEALEARGIGFLDSPVSGMQSRAEDGTLTMMVGGDKPLLDRHGSALASMAETILHMGPAGSGQLTKLINQLLFDINAAALAEILPLAVRLGLDPERVGQVVNSGTGRSYASEFFIPQLLAGDFSKGYPLAAAYKDLISGGEISLRERIPLPVLAAATATYQQALLKGHGAKDKGAMVHVFEDLLDVRFRANPGE